METPMLAIDHVSPEAADGYLAIFALMTARYPALTEEHLRDLRYRVAYAVEHGTPIVITPREAAGLLRERA